MPRNIIRVSEFEKLYYDEGKPFKKRHWEALCRYLDKGEMVAVEGCFRIINKGIQFTNFVGVIQAGNLTIEVLPKVDRDTVNAVNERVEDLDAPVSAEKGKWHGVLLQMLRECRFLKVNHVDYANLNLRSNSILEIYLEMFLSEANRLLHEGLLKKYRRVEGNQSALKGQLQFSKQITHNCIHQEKFYVSFPEYNRDNIYNQLIYKTLRLIPKITGNVAILEQVRRLLLDFPEMEDCRVSLEVFSRLSFDRKAERYKEAMLIGQMLLLNFRPDITGGSENVIAILFDMNKLWEEWVYRRLKREEGAFGVKVLGQESKEFWDSKALSSPKTVRPDVVIESSSGKRIVIDTKWKMIEDLLPSDADLKQMFVYNLFWGCEQSILLYPSVDGKENEGEFFDFRERETPGEMFTGCRVRTVNVLDGEGRLREDFGEVVMRGVTKNS